MGNCDHRRYRLNNISRQALTDGLEWNYGSTTPAMMVFLTHASNLKSCSPCRCVDLVMPGSSAHEERRKPMICPMPIGNKDDDPRQTSRIQRRMRLLLHNTRALGYRRGLVPGDRPQQNLVGCILMHARPKTPGFSSLPSRKKFCLKRQVHSCASVQTRIGFYGAAA